MRSKDQAMQVKDTIDTYERCTSQLINSSKCSIMFKGDEETVTQAQVQHILGVGTRAFETKYLGLPHYRIQTFCREPKTSGKCYFTLGKDPPAKNWPAKISLLGAFYRAPGKDFAESKHSLRQRKVTITAPAPSVLFCRELCQRHPANIF